MTTNTNLSEARDLRFNRSGSDLLAQLAILAKSASKRDFEVLTGFPTLSELANAHFAAKAEELRQHIQQGGLESYPHSTVECIRQHLEEDGLESFPYSTVEEILGLEVPEFLQVYDLTGVLYFWPWWAQPLFRGHVATLLADCGWEAQGQSTVTARARLLGGVFAPCIGEWLPSRHIIGTVLRLGALLGHEAGRLTVLHGRPTPEMGWGEVNAILQDHGLDPDGTTQYTPDGEGHIHTTCTGRTRFLVGDGWIEMQKRPRESGELVWTMRWCPEGQFTEVEGDVDREDWVLQCLNNASHGCLFEDLEARQYTLRRDLDQ